MTRPAIRVEGLSKEYVLGGEATQQKTFREMLAGAAREPIKRLKMAMAQLERLVLRLRILDEGSIGNFLL